MTNKEAIYIINNRLNTYYCTDEDLQALNLAIKALEERPQGEWIPVSERLPEENGDYLTTTMNDEVYCDYWNGINFNRTEQIIAWCPLPEPYERGVKDA